MAMPITVPTYTVEDLDPFPEDGNRYELLDGLLLVSPGPGLPHQVVTGRLMIRLGQLLRPWPRLLVTSPGPVIQRPKTRLEPDILVFGAPIGEATWDAVRDKLLAVETTSQSTHVYDRDFKRPAYLELGVAEVWRVDLDQECIRVSRPGAPPDQTHTDDLVWSPAGIGTSFLIEIRPLFAGLG